MKGQMFFVPVGLFPMLRRIFFHKILNSIPEFGSFQQEELNDEEADLSLAAFLCPQHLLTVHFNFVMFHSKYRYNKIRGPFLINFCFLRKLKTKALTKHNTNRSMVTILYFQIMSFKASTHLLTCCSPLEFVNSKTK